MGEPGDGDAGGVDRRRDRAHEATRAARGWLSPGERRALWWLGVLGALLWLALGPLTKVPLTVDEGQHLIGARHILLSPEHLIRHQRYVGGHADWPLLARTYWTYPPTLDALYAVSLGAFGMTPVAHGLPLLLAAALGLASVGAIARRLSGADTALVAVVLLLFARAAVDQGTMLECEPFVAALGMASVALALRGTMDGGPRWLAAAGAVGGAAFLFKLWLVFPVPLMVGALLLAGAAGRLGWRGALAGGLAYGAAFAAVGSLHVLLIAAVAPQDLPLWREVYLGSLTRQAPASEVQPRWFYGAVLYRDLCVLALPLLAFLARLPGLDRRDDRGRATLALAGATALSLVGLTLAGRKESLYAYPVAPALVLFAALGLARLAEASAAETRRLGALAGGLSLLAAVGAAGAAAAGLGRSALTPTLAGVHAAAMGGAALGILAFAIRGARPRALRWVMVGIAVAWGGWEGAAHLSEQINDPVRPLARFLTGPQEARPTAMGDPRDSFVSSHWLPLSYYTWIRGRPWWGDGPQDAEAVMAALPPEMRLYQIDKTFTAGLGGPPDAAAHATVLAWLRSHAVDITAEVERQAGGPLSTYVFIPGPDPWHLPPAPERP